MTAKDDLTRRALTLGLLARGFSYPDRAFRDELTSGTYQAELLDLLRSVEGDEAWVETVAGLQEALAVTDPAALESEHTYLFSRTVVASPYASSYNRDQGFARVHDMSDVASFYAAFGFRVASGAELPDHVGAELEFLGVLHAKEAYARERGWLEQAETCSRAREKFIAEHLSTWFPAFVQRVVEHGRHPFYPALAGVAQRLLLDERSRLSKK